MQDIASNYTIIPASSTELLIEEGNSIIIYGFHFNSAGSDLYSITFEEADGSNSFELTSAASSLTNACRSNTPWLADKGLRVTTNANTTGIVFHSNTGA